MERIDLEATIRSKTTGRHVHAEFIIQYEAYPGLTIKSIRMKDLFGHEADRELLEHIDSNSLDELYKQLENETPLKRLVNGNKDGLK